MTSPAKTKGSLGAKITLAVASLTFLSTLVDKGFPYIDKWFFGGEEEAVQVAQATPMPSPIVESRYPDLHLQDDHFIVRYDDPNTKSGERMEYVAIEDLHEHLRHEGYDDHEIALTLLEFDDRAEYTAQQQELIEQALAGQMQQQQQQTGPVGPPPTGTAQGDVQDESHDDRSFLTWHIMVWLVTIIAGVIAWRWNRQSHHRQEVETQDQAQAM